MRSFAPTRLSWTGDVPASDLMTCCFVVSHTGDYGDVVNNTVRYEHPS
jgi:hypothetical protein